MYSIYVDLVFGYYDNKHSGYVVNPMIITVHQLPFPASQPCHLEVIAFLLIQSLCTFCAT